ncbi:MAG: hypothetical protein ABI882_16435 [Acidobacteriota bacterium]
MDEELQKLVKKLGEAINDSINDSTSVNAALEELREAGHDAFLVLEATIAFKDRPIADPNSPPLQELSKEDQQFLRSLNIRLDPEE